MLERTEATMNEVLEPITFILAYHTVFVCENNLHIWTKVKYTVTLRTLTLPLPTVIIN